MDKTQAKLLLQNPALEQAFTKAKATYMTRWTMEQDQAQRDVLWHKQSVIDDVLAEVRIAARDSNERNAAAA